MTSQMLLDRHHRSGEIALQKLQSVQYLYIAPHQKQRSRRLEIVVVDFTILEKDQRECENVMVMTDVFFFPNMR